MKVTTKTTINTAASLHDILDTHFPLVTPEYYAPRKDEGVSYQHVAFDTKTGTRAVICTFDDATIRDRENKVLEDLFIEHYGMTFDEAMASINLTFKTEVL